LGDSKISVS